MARVPWDDKMAKQFMPDWSKKTFADWNKGEPDVVYYVYDPNYKGPYRGDEGKLVATEDEALEIQQRAVEEFNPEKRPQPSEYLDLLQQARQEPLSAVEVREGAKKYGVNQMELPLR